jgi:hypothetical protein
MVMGFTVAASVCGGPLRVSRSVGRQRAQAVALPIEPAKARHAGAGRRAGVGCALAHAQRARVSGARAPRAQGRKSANEKFAGSLYSMSVEAYVPATGRGCQAGTSHCLGQNFSRMFGIEFEAEDRSKQLAWQNSWGLSTRTIGIAIMVHGDDKARPAPREAAAAAPRCGRLHAAGCLAGMSQRRQARPGGGVVAVVRLLPPGQCAHWPASLLGVHGHRPLPRLRHARTSDRRALQQAWRQQGPGRSRRVASTRARGRQRTELPGDVAGAPASCPLTPS